MFLGAYTRESCKSACFSISISWYEFYILRQLDNLCLVEISCISHHQTLTQQPGPIMLAATIDSKQRISLVPNTTTLPCGELWLVEGCPHMDPPSQLTTWASCGICCATMCGIRLISKQHLAYHILHTKPV